MDCAFVTVFIFNKFREYASVVDRAFFSRASDVEAEDAEAAPVERARVCFVTAYSFVIFKRRRVDIAFEREVVA